MKIAIVLRASKVWGAERSLLTLLRTRVAKGHQITVMLPKSSPLNEWLSDLAHLEVINMELDFLDKPVKELQVRDLTSVGKTFLKHGVALSRHLQGYDASVAFGLVEAPLVGLAAKKANVPFVFDFHVHFGSRATRALLPLLTALADCIIVPTAATWKQSGVRSAPRKSHIVPRPVDVGSSGLTPLQAACRTPVQGRRLKVGVFGQVEPVKQVSALLRACLPHSRSIDIQVVGQPMGGVRSPYQAEVETLCRAGGWSSVERTDAVYEIMSQCDVVVNCAKAEAFGRTVVEGALLGAIPVVLGGTGPEESVRSLGFGFVEDSIEDIARRLQDIHSRMQFETQKVTSDQIAGWRRRYSPEHIAEDYFAHLSL